jgi:lysophospholipase L1-like esterase
VHPGLVINLHRYCKEADDSHALAPPPMGEPRGAIAPKFEGGQQRCVGLVAAYQQVAAELGCHFFDAGSVTPASAVDGIHLDAAQHRTLGQAMVKVVAAVIGG